MGILKNFAREVSADRIVDEGTIITAGGVTASIDLGLYLCEKIAGTAVREKIQGADGLSRVPGEVRPGVYWASVEIFLFHMG